MGPRGFSMQRGRQLQLSQKTRAASPHTAVMGLGWGVLTGYESLEGKDKRK